MNDVLFLILSLNLNEITYNSGDTFIISVLNFDIEDFILNDEELKFADNFVLNCKLRWLVEFILTSNVKCLSTHVFLYFKNVELQIHSFSWIYY